MLLIIFSTRTIMRHPEIDSGEPEQSPPKLPREEIMHIINRSYEEQPQVNPKYLETLVEHVGELPEYRNYKTQHINYETFDEIVSLVDQHVVDPKNRGLLEKTQKTIKSLAHDVQSSISNYFNIIHQIEHFENKSRFRLDDRTYREELSVKDRYRRSVHDGLLTNLRAFSRFCYSVIPGRFPNLKIPENKLFTSGQLSDRGYIGQWAFNTELGRRIEDVLGHANNKKEA